MIGAPHIFVYAVFLVFFQLLAIDAIIPRICVDNVTATGGSGVCCPTPVGANHPCGGAGVGSCQVIKVQHEVLPDHIQQDDRMHWPARFLEKACECEGNYFGVACDECWFGWKGPLCNQRDNVIRRNIMSYTEKERAMFVNIVDHSITKPSQYAVLFDQDEINSDPLWNPKFIDINVHQWIAYIHNYASHGTLYDDPKTCELYPLLNTNHDVAGFGTWHRYQLLIWERELRTIAQELYGWENFALPYWDWVDSTECDVCVNSIVGAPGEIVDGVRYIDSQSPFSKWTELCRVLENGTQCFGCYKLWPNFRPLNRNAISNEYPTTSDLQFTLNLKKYYLSTENSMECLGFHQALEGFCGQHGQNTKNFDMHNRVHVLFNGTFLDIPTSSNDPIFILHHNQIDRIMQLWFQQNKPNPTEYPTVGVEPGNCPKCNIIGFFPVVTNEQMFVDTRELGYEYDNFKFGKNGYDGSKHIN